MIFIVLLTFLKKNYQLLILLALLLTAAYIKFYRVEYFITYNFEIAQHYLQMIKLSEGQWLIEGPLSTHDWFRFSATPYYLFYPLFWLSDFHPLFLSSFWLGVSVLLVPMVYLVSKHIFNRRAALIATLLYVGNSNVLLMDRNMSFFAFVLPLSLLLFWETKKVFFLKTGRLWLNFLLISIMGTLHPSSFMLLPLYAIWSVRLKLDKRQYVTCLLAFVAPQIPLLLHEIERNFKTTISFILWVPYKAVQFLSGRTIGFQKNEIEDRSFELGFEFLTNSFLPDNVHWAVGILFFIFLLIFVHYSLKKKKHTFELFLASLLVYGFTVLIVHKNSPPHYFVPIMLAPTLLVGSLTDRLLAVFPKKWPVIVLLLIFLIMVQVFWIKDDYFSQHVKQPFSEQEEITKAIIQDAQAEKYMLQREGEFDYYPQQASENYIYLLRWLGNKPVAESELEYTIVEDSTVQIESEKTMIYDTNNVRVFKKDTVGSSPR